MLSTSDRARRLEEVVTLRTVEVRHLNVELPRRSELTGPLGLDVEWGANISRLEDSEFSLDYWFDITPNTETGFSAWLEVELTYEVESWTGRDEGDLQPFEEFHGRRAAIDFADGVLGDFLSNAGLSPLPLHMLIANSYQRYEGDVGDVECWRELGFAHDEGIKWAEHGFDPDSAAAFRNRGFHLFEAIHWHSEGFDADEASEWNDAGIGVNAAIEWSSWSPAEAISWIGNGTGPSEAADWIDARNATNFEVEDLVALAQSGTRPADLTRDLRDAVSGAD